MPDIGLERARVSLLGLAIGDAFGEALSNQSEAERRAAIRLMPRHRPWRWTDDTAMALSIVDVLARHATIDVDALSTAFVQRFVAEPGRGYGKGAHDLLTLGAKGARLVDEARRLFGGRGSWGNGAAMRAAPIGAYFAPDLERVRGEATRSAEITHTHPDGVAGAVAVGIAAALVTTAHDRSQLVDEVARWTPDGQVAKRLRQAAKIRFTEDVTVVGEALGTGLDMAAHDTVPFAVWLAARHLDSFEDAIWAANAQPGDRDTLGAIIGGIVVLATGVDAIPVLWRAALEPLPA